MVIRRRTASRQDGRQPISGPKRALIRELERQMAELREKPTFSKQAAADHR
ncbi:hypothetical protein [Spongiactinospora sp. 9N601]|uniref:hypothetical protein n=1 Tax=Spongiactinospora sp. 9N601 TaxID=3375149 RepID=UPI0037894EB5